MSITRIAFTGGGTGGHIYPNIAIYETLKDKYPDLQALYIGNQKGAENTIIRDQAYPIIFKTVPSKGLPMRVKSFKTLAALFYIFIGFLKSFFLLYKFKPDLVVGSGGYVAAPVLLAAALLRIKIFIHEQNAVPGRMNKLISRFASRIGVSFNSTKEYFNQDKVKVTGYPLRKLILLKDHQKIKERYEIPRDNKVIFIFGGSRGSKPLTMQFVIFCPPSYP